MNPSRRGFLKLFGLAAVAAPVALDPERLLWVRGAKTISIPSVTVPVFDELSAVTLATLRRDSIADNFFIDTPWMRLIRSNRIDSGFYGGSFIHKPINYAIR